MFTTMSLVLVDPTVNNNPQSDNTFSQLHALQMNVPPSDRYS